MTVSLERYEGVQFSGFVGGDSTGILVKYPDAKISFTSALDMFSVAIWIGGIISGMAMAAISVILSYVAKRLRVIDGQLPVMRAETVSWYLYAIMVSQGDPLSISSIMVDITSRSVVSCRPEINSYHDLALATDYKATVLMGSIQDIDLLRARNGDPKIIADRIQKCSVKCKLFSFQEMEISVLEEDKCVSIIPWAPGIDALRKYNLERVKCRLALAYEKTLWRPMFLAVPKSSPYIEEINRGSLWFFDTGLRDYWFKDYEQLPKQCRLNYNNKGVATKRSNAQLNLKHFYLAFLILIIGYLLAFLQFCREKFIVGLFGLGM
uniref:Uncharacterized protein n=1 Tax=Daphnia galeata TaxID=27404 RepID=A0A8J2RMY2_9CRUS|nr:unnamed protein product [Daphnia galeata]